MPSCHHAFITLGAGFMPAESPAKTVATTHRAPSRIGKKGVTFYLEPNAFKQLRRIGVDEDTTLQSLMIEAANMLFKSRRKAEIAK